MLHYVHRGAPGDERAVRGADVVGIGRSFLDVRDGARTTSIPFHRVFLIERGGTELWRRRGPGR